MNSAALPNIFAWSSPFRVKATLAGSTTASNSTFRSKREPARMSARSIGKIVCASADEPASAAAKHVEIYNILATRRRMASSDSGGPASQAYDGTRHSDTKFLTQLAASDGNFRLNSGRI